MADLRPRTGTRPPSGPDDDYLLNVFVAEHFAGNDKPVVSYGDATVPTNDLVRQQLFLPDGRRVRIDWSSPRRRGDTGTWFVICEAPNGVDRIW